MAIDSQALAGLEQPQKNEKTAEADNLHSGDFLSSSQLSLAAGSSRFEPHRGGRSGGTDNSGDSSLPTVILLKQQKDESARVAQVSEVAGKLADYIEGAHDSLDIAIYHFQLSGDPSDKTSPMGKVVAALNDKAEQGVKIRLAIFQPEQKGVANDDGEEAAAGPDFMKSLSSKIDVHNAAKNGDVNSNVGGLDPSIQTEGIAGGGKLMHDKFIVRDGATNDASVWTGSTNFTDDAFGSQDNNIIQLKSKDLASVYEEDFQQMWDAEKISGTGKGLHQTVQVGDSQVTVAFSPGDGAFIDGEIAKQIESAQQSVHIASMDISSQKVLQALSDKIDQGVNVDGIYDGPQMNVVVKDWQRSSSQASQDKVALWNKVKDHLVEKHSHPYRPGQLADFMHNKTVDIDDSTVITGSFNFSTNATHNAENIVEIANPDVAKQYGNYIQDLIVTYGGMQANDKSK